MSSKSTVTRQSTVWSPPVNGVNPGNLCETSLINSVTPDPVARRLHHRNHFDIATSCMLNNRSWPPTARLSSSESEFKPRTTFATSCLLHHHHRSFAGLSTSTSLPLDSTSVGMHSSNSSSRNLVSDHPSVSIAAISLTADINSSPLSRLRPQRLPVVPAGALSRSATQAAHECPPLGALAGASPRQS